MRWRLVGWLTTKYRNRLSHESFFPSGLRQSPKKFFNLLLTCTMLIPRVTSTAFYLPTPGKDKLGSVLPCMENGRLVSKVHQPGQERGFSSNPVCGPTWHGYWQPRVAGEPDKSRDVPGSNNYKKKKETPELCYRDFLPG